MTTYLALMYDVVDDYVERRAPLRPEHLALAEAARARGELLAAGAFAEPADSALLVWSEGAQDAIEAFVAKDPYVTNGLVTQWAVRPWNVAVGSVG